MLKHSRNSSARYSWIMQPLNIFRSCCLFTSGFLFCVMLQTLSYSKPTAKLEYKYGDTHTNQPRTESKSLENLYDKTEKSEPPTKKHCQGYITVPQMGRMANIMSCYGYLYGVSRSYNVRPILSDSMKAKLSTLFPSLTIPSFSDLNCDYGQGEFKGISGIHGALQSLSGSDSFPIHILPKAMIGSTFRYAYLGELRQVDFKINSHIVQVVQEALNRVKTAFLDRHEPISGLLFAGIHSRRTDFENTVVQERGGVPVTEKYFLRAMDEFRGRFGIPIVFVIASDDPEWVKEKFSHLPDVFFAADMDRKNINPTLFDFALLSNCNHTIQSYGGFGSWAAILSGGHTIVPNVFNQLDINTRPYYEFNLGPNLTVLG